MALGWAVLTAARDVAAGKLVQSFPPMLFALAMGLLCFFAYGLLNLGRGNFKKLWQMVLKHRMNVVALSIASLVVWITSIFSVKFLEPAVASVVTLGVTPLTTSIFSRWLRPNAKSNMRDWVASLGIMLGVSFLAYHSLSARGGLGEQPYGLIVVGFGCAVVSGVLISLAMYFAKDLYDAGWKPAQVVFVRLWGLTFFLSIYVCSVMNPLEATYWTAENSITILGLGIFCSFLPIYLSQSSLRILEPLVYSKILCLLPVFAFMFQFLDGRISYSEQTAIGIALILIFVFYGARGNVRKNLLVKRLYP